MKQFMISIPSNSNSIQKIESYLQAIDLLNNVKEDKYADILISLTEAVNNAVIHGNNNDETKLVHIYIKHKDNGISFCVADEGHGFNPSRIPDPTCEENLECCGGRGVYIMKALCDDIIFQNNGSTVEMYFDI